MVAKTKKNKQKIMTIVGILSFIALVSTIVRGAMLLFGDAVVTDTDIKLTVALSGMLVVLMVTGIAKWVIDEYFEEE